MANRSTCSLVCNKPPSPPPVPVHPFCYAPYRFAQFQLPVQCLSNCASDHGTLPAVGITCQWLCCGTAVSPSVARDPKAVHDAPHFWGGTGGGGHWGVGTEVTTRRGWCTSPRPIGANHRAVEKTKLAVLYPRTHFPSPLPFCRHNQCLGDGARQWPRGCRHCDTLHQEFSLGYRVKKTSMFDRRCLTSSSDSGRGVDDARYT